MQPIAHATFLADGDEILRHTADPDVTNEGGLLAEVGVGATHITEGTIQARVRQELVNDTITYMWVKIFQRVRPLDLPGVKIDRNNRIDHIMGRLIQRWQRGGGGGVTPEWEARRVTTERFIEDGLRQFVIVARGKVQGLAA